MRIAEGSLWGHMMTKYLRNMVWRETGCKKIILYPNSDPGSNLIISVIKKFQKKYPDIKVYKNISYKTYLSLLKYAVAVVGNSSGQTVETIPFKTPVINIGIRQKGRERGQNIIDVGHNQKEIINAFKKINSKKFLKQIKNIKNPFGDGKTGEKIAEIFDRIKIDETLSKKQITY